MKQNLLIENTEKEMKIKGVLCMFLIRYPIRSTDGGNKKENATKEEKKKNSKIKKKKK